MSKRSTRRSMRARVTIACLVLFASPAAAQFPAAPPKVTYPPPTTPEETNRYIEESDRFAVFIVDALPWNPKASAQCAALVGQLEYHAVPQEKVQAPPIPDPIIRERALTEALQSAEEAMIGRHAALTELMFRGLRLGCLALRK